MKKISDLKVIKTVNRPTRARDKYGNRIYQNLDFKVPYEPAYKHNSYSRLAAKIFDLLIFFPFSYLIVQYFITALFFSIIFVIIYGTITETLYGKTIGKNIFKLEVLNDFAKKTNLLKSFFRNLISPLNLTPRYYYNRNNHPMLAYGDSFIVFNMNLNNFICDTYVIKKDKKEEILKMLKNKNH